MKDSLADRPTVPKGSWTVQDRRLLYSRDGNDWAQLPAQDVWSAAFSGGENGGTTESPVNALPEFEFSRFPAELAIAVTGSTPNNIQASLVGISNGKRAPLVAPKVDQVFIGNTWHPIQVENYQEAFSALADVGIVSGQEITIGQLIWLKTHAPKFGLVVFDSVQSCNPAEVHAPSAMNVDAWGLRAKLYSYQSDGVHYLKLMADQGLGCILGDEMGLGKTVQVIALMLAEKSAGRGPTLVVMPATLLENWRRELVSFSPTLSIKVHAGSDRVGIAARLSRIDVVLTSYETAVRDEPLLSSIPWNMLVLDEAQNIKNPDAQRTLAVKAIPRRISLAVTGTPVENRLIDLWSLSDFVLPGLLGNREEFERVFADTDSDAAYLAPIVAPILLRRRVREVAKDLPEKIDIAQPIPMSRFMAEQYEEVRKAALAEYGKSGSLVALQRLRMFCTHPTLIDDGDVDPAREMPKYQRLVEILEEIFSRDEKVLIFTSYTGMTDTFMSDLPERFPSQFFSFIDGRVPISKRQQTVDLFSTAGAGALFLNPKAAGVGLNITTANHVIHYNPEWNPAVQDQATARAFRRKQVRPVTVYQMFFADTVEEVIVGRLGFKRTLAENAATGHEGGATASEVMEALTISPFGRLGSLE